MGIRRWTESYVCDSRRWLVAKLLEGLDEQIEQVWFDLCGFDGWTFDIER